MTDATDEPPATDKSIATDADAIRFLADGAPVWKPKPHDGGVPDARPERREPSHGGTTFTLARSFPRCRSESPPHTPSFSPASSA